MSRRRALGSPAADVIPAHGRALPRTTNENAPPERGKFVEFGPMVGQGTAARVRSASSAVKSGRSISSGTAASTSSKPEAHSAAQAS